jgi:NodT family efflux transporter outer membrane factor (OMF) lipoprotein
VPASVKRHLPPMTPYRSVSLRLLPTLVFTLLIGCSAAPLPQLKPPVPTDWRNVPERAYGAKAADLTHWWFAFNDAQLNSLIDRALQNNLDVKAAAERVLAERTLNRHVHDAYLPNLHAMTNDAIEPDASASYFIAGFDSLWEFPLFGALKSSSRVGRGNLDAADAELRGADVTLVAEVARRWIELRSAQEQARLLGQVRDADQQKQQLLEVRTRLHLVSPTEVATAQAELARADAALAEPQQAINANAQQLAVLLGQPEPDPEWLQPGTQPQLGNWQLTSAPADLLRTRPEIATAEAEVLRSAGELGISRSEIYPHIGLGTSLQWSLNIAHNHHIHSSEGIFSVGPVIDIPLFDWGQRLAVAHAKDHELRANVYAYRQAVLEGVAETETAMGDLQQLHMRESASEQAAQALDQNAAALDKRRALGLSSTLELQDSLIEQQRAQLELVSARAARDLAYVSLYKALGGAPLTDAYQVVDESAATPAPKGGQ